MNIAITVTERRDYIDVKSPFNEDFIADAKELGGRWDGGDRVWRFRRDLREHVYDLLFDHYDWTPEDEATA